MLVHALVAAIRTGPEPAVLLVLDGLDEVLADLLGRRARVSMLAHNDIAQLLLVPVVYRVSLLSLLLGRLDVSRVGVKIDLGRLALHVGVMAEFALAALLTVALLEEDTKHGLGVHAEGHLLDMHGLEQLRRILLGLLSGLLLSGQPSSLSFLSLLVRSLVGLCLSLQLSDLFLGLGSFFLWQISVSWVLGTEV